VDRGTTTLGEAINGDLAARVAVDTAGMAWTASPSRTVWRKRVHRVGPQEAGQVTSVVRYEAGAEFPAHDHPDGEEILVLEGVFSDEHGDWPAGTYLLNPEGFRHAPFSREGCVLLVKLRQFPGHDRRHVAIQTDSIAWRPTTIPGVDVKPLYAQAGHPDTARLERWAPGAALGERVYPGGVEIFVLDGEFGDADGRYARWAWLRLPAGGAHAPATATGCVVFVKDNALGLLQSAPAGEGP
jgi:anti-sigma factor ChrR (cupin superfamily)